MADFLCTFENLTPNTAAARRAAEDGTPGEYNVILTDPDFEALRSRFSPMFCYSEPVYRIVRHPRTGILWKIVDGTAYNSLGATMSVYPEMLAWPITGWANNDGRPVHGEPGYATPYVDGADTAQDSRWTQVKLGIVYEDRSRQDLEVWYDTRALVKDAVRAQHRQRAEQTGGWTEVELK